MQVIEEFTFKLKQEYNTDNLWDLFIWDKISC